MAQERVRITGGDAGPLQRGPWRTEEQMEGWGDGSVRKGIPMRAQGPEFDVYHPCENPGMLASACNPSAQGAETSVSLGLTGQSAELSW